MRTKGRDKAQQKVWEETHKKICMIVQRETVIKPLYGISGDAIARHAQIHRNTVREHCKSDSNFKQIGHNWVWKPDFQKIQLRLSSTLNELLREGHAKVVPIQEYGNVESHLSVEGRQKARRRDMFYVTIDEEGLRRMGVKDKDKREAEDQGKNYKPKWLKHTDLTLDKH